MIRDKCSTKYCSRLRKKKHSKCSRCVARRQKEINPIGYFFNLLRCNAKRRGKDFSLTIQQFRAFCRRTGYMKHKGRTGKAMSIDRIRSWEGYHIGNIDVLTVSENAAKGAREAYLPHNQPGYIPKGNQVNY